MSGLWPIVVRALWSRRWRTALTAIAVALGIAVILGVQTVLAGLDAQAQQAVADRAGKSDLDIRTTTDDGFTRDQVNIIANGIPGVAEAIPLYEKRIVARATPPEKSMPPDVDGVGVVMVSVAPDGTSALRPVYVSSGRLPKAGSQTEVAIDGALATTLGNRLHTTVTVGSTIQLTSQTGPDNYTVVGLTTGTSGGAAFTHSAVFATETEMTNAFALGVHIPLVAVRLESGTSAATVDQSIVQTFGSNRFTVVDPRNGGTPALAELRPLLVLMTALSLLVGAGVTANSVSLSALERRREIALLRAGGASAVQVMRAFFAEAALTSAIGVPIGVLAGIALAWVMTAAFSDLPARTMPSLSAGTTLAACGIGFFSGILGAAIPAVEAARRPILEGLRPHVIDASDRTPWRIFLITPVALVLAAICFIDGSSDTTTVGAVLIVAALVAALPALTPLVVVLSGAVIRVISRESGYAVRNLRRRRNRTALTIAGLTVAVACAMASSTLAGGAASASDTWVRKLLIGDVLVTSPVTQPDSIASAVAESGDVKSVATVRLMSAPVDGDVTGIAVVDPSAYQQSGGLDITTPQSRATVLSALQTQSAVLIPASMAASDGFTVGTPLVIDTGTETAAVHVVGIVAHSFPSGDGRESVVMSRNLASRIFGVSAGGFDDLMVTTGDGDGTSVRRTAATYGLSAYGVSDVQASARASLTHSVGLLEAIAAVALLISLLAVINTLAVNVRLSTRELALLRAVGLSRRRALRLVLTEAALMALAGTVLGLAGGALLALPMLASSSTPGFTPPFSYAFPVAGIVVLAVLAGTLVAAIFPARRAVATSIVAAIRYE